MVAPLSAVAPVILPVMVPMVQAKVLDAVAVNAMSVLVALQMVLLLVVVTTGVGLTVTVMV